MSTSGTENNRSYLQETYQRVKNTVFSPKVESTFRTKMDGLLPQRPNTLDNVKIIAEECAFDIVFYVSKHKCRTAPQSYAKTMRRTVDEVLTKHEINFKSMVRKLNREVFLKCQSSVDADLEVDLDSSLSEEGDSVDYHPQHSEGGDSGLEEDHQPSAPAHPVSTEVQEVLTSIANDLFGDGVFNWGRIVTLYAFAGALARHLVEEHKLAGLLEDIAECVSQFMKERLAVWILKHGGWVSRNDVYSL